MKWTVLFIVQGLGDGLQEQSKVLTNAVGYGNWLLHHTNLLYLKSSVQYEGKEKMIVSNLYKVSSRKERRSGEPDVTRAKRFINVNIGNSYRLSSIFSHVRREFPSERLMVVFFDHGAGFGLFEPIPEKWSSDTSTDLNDIDEILSDQPSKNTQKLYIPPASTRRPIKYKGRLSERLSGGAGNKKGFQETDMLTMHELSEAIRIGFRRKVDVMVMVNCNMQMIETGYALRKNVHYLVASETLFWVYGINYRELLFRIDRIPKISPEKVAKVCLETLPFRYERIGKTKNLNDVGFFAINLEKMTPVYQELGELADRLASDIKPAMKLIGRARKQCVELSQYGFTKEQKEISEPSFLYDLLCFLDNLEGYEEEAKRIRYYLSRAIVEKYIGSDFSKDKLVNGVSVFLPFTKDDFGMQYFGLFYSQKAKFRIDFANSPWGNLLLTMKKNA